MIRNYKVGVYETQTLQQIAQVTDGTDQYLQIDGVLSNAFSDLLLYSDSGGTSPLTEGTDYNMTTVDTAATAKEAGTGGSGKTVYSQFEVINATYQNVDLWATCTNFGTYTDNDAPFTQQGGSLSVATTSSIEIPGGYHKYRVNIDTTVGDVTLTVGDGQFDGQEILLKETGNGNKSRIKGNGFYDGADAGGMYLVSRSILCTWNADDSEWEMDDCVTAEWTDTYDINCTAHGHATVFVVDSFSASTGTTSRTTTLPISLNNIYASGGPTNEGADGSQVTQRIAPYSTSSTTIKTVFSNNLAQALSITAIVKGKY